MSSFGRVCKRGLDLLVSFIAILTLWPLLAALAAAIRFDSSGPVFYRGLRAGFRGKPFRILKFRTMVSNAENKGPSSTADSDPRITRIGMILRNYKLDELPQLLNVFMGQMSLVGPRPQVMWAVERYTKEEREVLSVRPGITDWASVRFPNEGALLRGSSDPDKDYFEKIHPEKMRLALEYVRHQSLWVDCQIIFQTLRVILFGPGAACSSPIQRPTTSA